MIVTRRLKACEGARFTGDGRAVIAGVSTVSAWSVPALEPLWKARPLAQPRGFATQFGGPNVLCANDRSKFALLDGETGETIAVCNDKGYVIDPVFALSACGAYAIYALGDRLRVREIRTNRLAWERRWDRGRARSIQPLQDGTAWMIHVVGDNDGPTRRQFEIWTWPFGAAPAHVLTPEIDVLEGKVSRGGKIVVKGHVKPGASAFQVFAPGASRPYAQREPRTLDHILGWLDEEHFVVGHFRELVTIYQAVSLTPVRTIELPGTLSTHDCHPSPSGEDLVVWYWQRGIALARGVLSREARGAGEAVRIDDPWPLPSKPPHEQHKPRENPWYRMPPPTSVRTLAADSIAALKEQLAEFRRNAWVPLVEEADGPATSSKFGGLPYLPEGTFWPRCGQCGDWLQLAVQLRSEDLPAELGRPFDGVLQAFFCTTDSCTPDQPFQPSTLVRVVADGGPSTVTALPFEEAFAGRSITGWRVEADYPIDAELEALGIVLRDGPEIGGDFFSPVDGDKLMGWPNWPHDVSYVRCPACGDAMQPIIELASERNVPHMFGDACSAWISQCRVHRDVLAFHCAV